MRCAYVDLDGTLLGRNGSLLHDGSGSFTLLGVRALEAAARAGVEVVLYSGRRRAQVVEDARLIGQSAFIFEVGCGLAIDGEDEYLTDDLVPGPQGTIHEQVAAAGAPALLLERYAGRLEHHAPWHLNREVSHLFRGEVAVGEANELLREHGHGNVRLIDNGVISHRSATLPELERLRVYHLIPSGASKARAVARHMQARGYMPGECIAIGDSREDLGAAEVVGAFWFVANALERDPTLRETIAGRTNVRVAQEAHGAGVYEAVITTLAERR